MLYVLTPGLIDEIKALSNHPGMAYKEHDLEELILFEHGFSASSDSVIFDAVKHLNQVTQIQSHNRFWFIARAWFGSTPDIYYQYDGSRNTDVGQWVYQYGRLFDNTLTVSKKYMSAVHEYTSNGILVHTNGKIIPVLDIVNSTEEKYFKLLIPGSKDMFAHSELKYRLPVSLLN